MHVAPAELVVQSLLRKGILAVSLFSDGSLWASLHRRDRACRCLTWLAYAIVASLEQIVLLLHVATKDVARTVTYRGAICSAGCACDTCRYLNSRFTRHLRKSSNRCWFTHTINSERFLS